MTILYSVISRGTTVLARHAACAGNFQEVTEQILKQIPPEDSKLTYSHDNYLFHYISENTIIYMCITDDVSIFVEIFNKFLLDEYLKINFSFQEFERSRAFLFLNEIKKKFQSVYGNRALTAIAYSMNTEFSRVLANEMKHYSDNQNIDTISRVHGELDELKEIMVKNIGKEGDFSF